MEYAELKTKVEAAFADRSLLADSAVKQAVLDTIALLVGSWQHLSTRQLSPPTEGASLARKCAALALFREHALHARPRAPARDGPVDPGSALAPRASTHVEAKLDARAQGSATTQHTTPTPNAPAPAPAGVRVQLKRSVGGDGYDTGRLTQESRRVWRDRTDITISALSKARQGVVEMKQLEKEAKALRQEPMYPEGKLDALHVDLNLKIEMLGKERDKRYLDDRKPGGN